MSHSISRNVTAAACLACLVAVPAVAGFSGTDVFLPSVARGGGSAGSDWYTCVWVHNPGASAAGVQFRLLKRDRPNPTAEVYNDTIEAGDTRRYDNAIETMFGEAAVGALRVTSSQRLVVNGRIYSVVPGEEARDSVGQFFAGIPASFAIARSQSTTILGVYQTSPQGSSQFRYNFGFVETTGSTATVKASAVDQTGSTVGSKTYTLGAFEARQYNITDLLPGVNAENLRLVVEVTAGSGRVVAFGSGIANRCNDPSTFEMTFADNLLAENASGGITGVTAGAGLSGGGTSGNVTVAVANAGIVKDMLADGSVTKTKLAELAVTTEKLAGSAVTPDKVSFNYAASATRGGPASDVGCSGCVASGEISASGGTLGQVLTVVDGGAGWRPAASVPDADWTVSGVNMYSAVSGNVGIGTTTPKNKLQVQTSGNSAVYATNTGTGRAATFVVDNTAGSGSAVWAESNGNGAAVTGTSTGRGSAAMFENTEAHDAATVEVVSVSSSNGLEVTQNGMGRGGLVRITNTSNAFRGFEATTTGTGCSAFFSGGHGVYISDVLFLKPRSSAPSSTGEGYMYVNSTTHHIYCYLNGSWRQLD